LLSGDADNVNINIDGFGGITAVGAAAGAGAVAGAGAAAGAGAFGEFDNGFDNGHENGFNNNGGFIESGIQGSLVGGHDLGGSQLPAQTGPIQAPFQHHGKSQTGHKTGGHFPEISHAQDIVHF
jgi:hypothetical protein